MIHPITPDRAAAARMLQATNPRHRPLTTLRTFERFAAEYAAEGGVRELERVVEQMRRHAALSRGRRAA